MSKQFKNWIEETTANLIAGSQVIVTPRGPIEYAIKGTGPVVLCLHGGFGTYHQSLLIGADLIQQGFTLLAPSRPGYLRTPLSVGKTTEEQADAMVVLLDALGISKVAVMGYSAGSSVAFQFALRHPDRVWGLILVSIGAQPQQAILYRIITKMLNLKRLADFGCWLLYLATIHYPFMTQKFILHLDNHLPPSTLKERIQYVLNDPNQSTFLSHFILSTIPVSLRKAGAKSDIQNLNPWQSYSYSLIKTPTLIIQAEADKNGSYAEALFVAKQIKGAQLITVKDSGHIIWLGKYTESWQSQLIDFLKNSKSI